MILLRETPFNGILKGSMLLTDKSGTPVYVSKTTYDQAIRIAVKFDDSPFNVQKIGFGEDPDYENDLCDSKIKLAIDNMPYPLNMLAPFLIILRTNNDGIITEDTTIEDIYGYLHVLSQSLDFYQYISLDMGIRSDVKITNHLYTSYKDNWEECFGYNTKVEYIGGRASNQPEYNHGYTPSVELTPNKSEDVTAIVVEKDEDGNPQVSEEKLAEFDDMWAALATPSKEENKKEERKSYFEDTEDVNGGETNASTSVEVLEEFGADTSDIEDDEDDTDI